MRHNKRILEKTHERMEYIREHFPAKTPKEIGVELGISGCAVNQLIQRMHLRDDLNKPKIVRTFPGDRYSNQRSLYA